MGNLLKTLVAGACLAILVVALFSTFGCAGKKYVKTTIHADEWIVVQLEEEKARRGSAKEKGYNHPISIEVKNLSGLLGSIYYKKNPIVVKKSKKLHPAFSDEEIELLVLRLQAALAKASSNQRIYFSSKAVKSGFIFAKDTLSNGVIFVTRNNFNIAFANLNYELKGTDRTTDTGYYTGDALDKAASNPLWELTPQGNQALAKIMNPKKDKVSIRNNWLVMPVKVVEPPKSREPSITIPEKETIPEEKVTEPKPQPSELEEPLEHMPRIETVDAPKNEMTSPDKAYEKNVHKKLRELKELRDEGLINEQEYQQMKGRILEDRY